MTTDAGRARRLLTRPSGWIEAAPDGYALRVGRDRRTRVLLTVDERVFRQLTENPGLKIRPGGGWMARIGVRSASPASPEPGRPGLIEGVRAVAEEDGALTSRRANLGQSAVVWLARRRDAGGRAWLTPREVAAADRLTRDAEAALRG
ncbi:DUF6456 domain-containing protein, partial [Brevundimonas sp.]|uniref:DUF6456 domain-containing protein n=1 Tax=Brevundimonas sp. TaxID=1871086 RepID=UPI002FCC251D